MLIGKSQPTGVHIEGYVPVLADDTGSHFVQSKFGRRDLRNYIGELNHLAGRVSVVGYFRNDLGKGIRLFEEDLAFFREYFSDPSNVFLVVRPGVAPHSAAGFFFWQNDRIFSTFSLLEFAFDERTRAPAAEPVPSRNGSVVSRVMAPAETPPVEPIAKKPVRNPAFSWLRVIGAGLAITSGLVLAAYLLRPIVRKPIIPETSGSGMASQFLKTGLSVSGAGKDVNLVWNRQAAIVAAARVGMLTIKDGELQREVPLTPDQLRSGEFKFKLHGDTVEITFEVFAHDGRVARENVTLISNPGAPSTTLTRAAPDPVQGPANGTESPEGHREPARSFVPPPGSLNTSAPTVAPPIELPPSPPAARMDVPRLDSTINQWPGAPKAVPTVTNKPDLPPIKPPEPSQTVSLPPHRPPVPIRQVNPVLPPSVRGMLSSHASIEIRVRVDAAGKVTAAEPLAISGSMGKLLGAAASSAARMWTFEPANDGRRNVPGELTIQFTFVPDKSKP
ncbi:MAG: hypothetical protein ACKV2U_19410 [Bryobacteraceae bacterium]